MERDEKSESIFLLQTDEKQEDEFLIRISKKNFYLIQENLNKLNSLVRKIKLLDTFEEHQIIAYENCLKGIINEASTV